MKLFNSFVSDAELGGYNRTIEELKPAKTYKLADGVTGYNRTIEELKRYF